MGRPGGWYLVFSNLDIVAHDIHNIQRNRQFLSMETIIDKYIPISDGVLKCLFIKC